MKFLEYINKSILFLIIFIFSTISFVKAEETETLEVIKTLQKDLKTLEKAVYSNSFENNEPLNSTENLDLNSEDVLTRHLLKLSDIESQFQMLTNKFEEINFKIDKLSNRLSKVQADNQLRFQDLENFVSSGDSTKIVSKDKDSKTEKALPGSSQPQDLGSVSYKDNTTTDTSQKIESIETTATIVTETFQNEEKIIQVCPQVIFGVLPISQPDRLIPWKRKSCSLFQVNHPKWTGWVADFVFSASQSNDGGQSCQ